MALDIRISEKLTEMKSEGREMIMSGVMIGSVIYCIAQHSSKLATIVAIVLVGLLVWEAVSGISEK